MLFPSVVHQLPSDTSKVRTPRDTEDRELQQAFRGMAAERRAKRTNRIKRLTRREFKRAA